MNDKVHYPSFDGLALTNALKSTLMVSTTHAIPVAEFRQLPKDQGSVYLEGGIDDIFG